jgi:hypothetical protein
MDVTLAPTTERGWEIIDQLEQRTGKLPYLTDDVGARTYWLPDAGPDVFDATLDQIDPAWRDHLNA